MEKSSHPLTQDHGVGNNIRLSKTREGNENIQREEREKIPDIIITATSLESLEVLNQKAKEETLKAKKKHKRSSMVVSGGALTFILLAATMVTTSFLMSPMIEEIFGKIVHIS